MFEKRTPAETINGTNHPPMGMPYLASLPSGSLNFSHSQKQGLAHAQEDTSGPFYENYRKVAEEYDKEFLKRYDEDLNTTLIFVSPVSPQADVG